MILVLWLFACSGVATDGGTTGDTGLPLSPPCELEPCVGDVAFSRAGEEPVGASLGYALAAHGDVLVAGAPEPFVQGPAHDAALVFTLPELAETGRLLADKPSSSTGGAVAIADLDGDGVVEIAVGSHWYVDSSYGGGRASLVHGVPDGPVGLEGMASLTVVAPEEPYSSNASDFVGYSVLLSEIAGEPSWLVAAPGRREVWVFDPDQEGTVGRDEARAVLSGPSFFGAALTTWDGRCDGALDLVVTSDEDVRWFEGEVSSGVDPAASWVHAQQADTSLGFRLRTDGDLDGDGCADLLMGAPFNDGPLFRSGGVYVVRGGAPVSAEASELPIQVVGDLEGEAVGYSVATGDLDGDGSDDLVVGAPSLHDGPPGGTVRLFLGPLSGVYAPDDADHLLHAERPGDFLGREMVIVDADGDARDDLAVSASSAYGGGAVYLITGADWLGGR